MHYMNRNGYNEQVRFYRQQPRYMASQSFDFEEKRKIKARTKFEYGMTIFCAIGLGVLLWMG